MSIAPKQQRLVLVILAIAAMGAAAALALWGLQGQAAYFVTPSQVEAGDVRQGEAVRLGGMVEAGSIERQADGSVTFMLADQEAVVAVSYAGILPNLFVEGSGAVAEGAVGPDGLFRATRILAKHDENYMPPELASEQAEAQTAETVAR